MAKVIEYVEAHYEIQDVVMGKVYRWCPEYILLECSCGKREAFVAFRRPSCSKCGADHAATIGEVLDSRLEDKVDHPWRSLHPYYTPARGS